MSHLELPGSCAVLDYRTPILSVRVQGMNVDELSHALVGNFDYLKQDKQSCNKKQGYAENTSEESADKVLAEYPVKLRLQDLLLIRESALLYIISF